MCGISGIVAPAAKTYTESLQRMVASLQHRGPDADGLCLFADCGLGHTRLSVVDLETGDQPMQATNRRAAITFNGEIYGYKTLRQRLGGYDFQTHSDTEVVLASYLARGPGFVTELPGMFAFAIWDDENRELLCARDRFGQKPLYYARGEQGEFLFASEIKALLASGLVEPVLDPEAVAHYLRYLHVLPDECIYRNIHVLPPAHLLRYRDGVVTVERYWQPPVERSSLSMSDTVDRFRGLLEQAVASHLVADVPVGAFLSGGLDSTTLVIAASRHCHDLRTFSFGFPDAENELPYAAEVARLCGTRHQELTIGDYDLGELICEMQRVYDEPFADSSNIPTYLICREASRHLKVVLTGDGGDEMLGGYSSWYLPLMHMHRETHYSAVKALLFRLLARALKTWSVSRSRYWQYREWGVNMRRDFASLDAAHDSLRSILSADELRQLGLSTQSGKAPGRDIVDPEGSLRDDVMSYLPGDILTKIDRASMAHGLELRAPFLDNELAAFCLSLPLSMKIRDGEDKLLLREAFASTWPESVRSRTKCGFGAPVGKWLVQEPVRRLVADYLLPPDRKIYQLIDHGRTRPLIDRSDYATWALLNLSVWLEGRDVRLDQSIP